MWNDESEFYQYLLQEGKVGRHTCTNYMSWLKFISQTYPLGNDLAETTIDDIISSERQKLSSRTIYTTEKDLGNFRSALHKYVHYLKSDFKKRNEETILSEINKIEHSNILQTEKDSIVKARIGQGEFRENLICYWAGCSVTGCQMSDILIASHIKPWRVASNQERLNVYNGLLLLPNLDKLFDKGYISFDTKGKVIFSSFFPNDDRNLLHLTNNIHLTKIQDEHNSFLLYHNQNCLIQ